jgi:inorganic pyrophosphatase
MVDYKTLPIGDQAPSVIHAVVEIPKDSKHKYEYDPKLGVFRLDRVLHSAVYYPTEYGFIPSTEAEDGDPLDVMIFLSWPTFPGCVLEVRPIGKLDMMDDKGIDEKILAVAQHDPHYQRIDDLEAVEMDELAREYHAIHDPEIPEEIFELARRLREMEH